MFAEHAFDVKDPGAGVVAGDLVTPRRPESVYRRRRAVAATVAAALVTLVLLVGRPERVPVGEANPWPSTAEVSLSTELPGVYVVRPGDTLWDIARALAPGEDPRAVVHDLAVAAGGAALEPGQRIVFDEVRASASASPGAAAYPRASQPAVG